MKDFFYIIYVDIPNNIMRIKFYELNIIILKSLITKSVFA